MIENHIKMDFHYLPMPQCNCTLFREDIAKTYFLQWNRFEYYLLTKHLLISLIDVM